MKKISFGLICVIFLSFLLVNNKLITLKEERNILIQQNEQLALQVEELTNNTFSRKEMFQIAAEVYQIDFNLIYAIAKHETGHFKSKLFIENNNPGGIKDFYSESGWAKYDSEFEGIMEMARLLRNNYYDYELNTLEKIGTKYCPNNPEWAKEVGSLIGQD